MERGTHQKASETSGEGPKFPKKTSEGILFFPLFPLLSYPYPYPFPSHVRRREDPGVAQTLVNCRPGPTPKEQRRGGRSAAR